MAKLFDFLEGITYEGLITRFIDTCLENTDLDGAFWSVAEELQGVLPNAASSSIKNGMHREKVTSNNCCKTERNQTTTAERNIVIENLLSFE